MVQNDKVNENTITDIVNVKVAIMHAGSRRSLQGQ